MGVHWESIGSPLEGPIQDSSSGSSSRRCNRSGSSSCSNESPFQWTGDFLKLRGSELSKRRCARLRAAKGNHFEEGGQA